MIKLLDFIKKFARDDDDSKDVTFKKLLILLIAVSCCVCGLIWSASYYIIFGFGLTTLLPFSFIIIVGIAILISHLIKNHYLLIYVQLACITWISALIQWSIGSISDSGLVIAWSFLGPLGALIFLSFRNAIIWMIMFLSIVIISAVFDPALLGEPQVVTENQKVIFYIMNIGASFSVVFGVLAWFVITIQYEKGRSEKLLEKIKTLFGQHVPTEVANELISEETDVHESKIFNVTIMFLDIRDFTVLADSRAPGEVANFQNTLFGEFINIIKDNRGIVIQILGDGIYASFGAPIVNDTHISDAVKAGYDMIKKTEELITNGKIPYIKLGIGIHSGNVIAGEIGNEYRKSYSLAGSNVIIASRIEQLNKEFSSQFLISKVVFDKLKDELNSYTYKGDSKLKGISKPIGIYQLI